MTQCPALGPPTRTLITCCPFCRAWRIVGSVAWPLPSEPYCAPVITLRVLIWVFLLSVGCCYFYLITQGDLRSSQWGFCYSRVTTLVSTRYLVAAAVILGSSRNSPIARLHWLHRIPRTCPSVWQWSIQAVVGSWLFESCQTTEISQIAHFRPWASNMFITSACEIPYLLSTFATRRH